MSESTQLAPLFRFTPAASSAGLLRERGAQAGEICGGPARTPVATRITTEHCQDLFELSSLQVRGVVLFSSSLTSTSCGGFLPSSTLRFFFHTTN
jgi:hypothetical protein